MHIENDTMRTPFVLLIIVCIVLVTYLSPLTFVLTRTGGIERTIVQTTRKGKHLVSKLLINIILRGFTTVKSGLYT